MLHRQNITLFFTNHVLLFTSNVHNGPSLNVVTGQKQSSDTTAVKSDLSGITGNGQYIQDIWGRIRDEPFLLIIQDVPAKTGSWQPYLHNNGQREVQVLFN